VNFGKKFHHFKVFVILYFTFYGKLNTPLMKHALSKFSKKKKNCPKMKRKISCFIFFGNPISNTEQNRLSFLLILPTIQTTLSKHSHAYTKTFTATHFAMDFLSPAPYFLHRTLLASVKADDPCMHF